VSSIFSGAGTSSGPPASLPLGCDFHRQLVELCLDAAELIAPGLLTAAARAALRGRRWNVIARLTACATPDTERISDVLSCFRVPVPNEAHLLCAFHLAMGGLHVTVNLDDGIERAYALLSGEIELPPKTPAVFGEALTQWRARFPRDRPELTVLSASPGPAMLKNRPLLVKIRGSAGASGLLLPRTPLVDVAESVHLGAARLSVFDELVNADFTLITGYSGADIDCFEPLMAQLRPGHFGWVAPRVEPAVAARLRAISPGQPRHGLATDALRALLPRALARQVPDWPRARLAGPGYPGAFAAWRRNLPVFVSAEVCAWMLTEARQRDLAVALLRRLLELTGSARVATRLADALANGGTDTDHAEAAGLRHRAARERQAPRGVRAYAWACRAQHLPDLSFRDRLVAALRVWWLARRHTPLDRVRVAEIIAHTMLMALRRTRTTNAVLLMMYRALVRCAILFVRRALGSVERAAVGIGRRHAALYVQLARLRAAGPVWPAKPMPADVQHSLDWAERVYAHLGDEQGRTQVAALREAGPG
jgi:hypothetical protein